MRTIHHDQQNCTITYQSGSFKQTREATPIMLLAQEAAERYPEIASRVWKAAIIFEDGGVELLPEDEQVTEFSPWGESVPVAKVRSKPDEPGYTVRRLYWNEPELGGPVPDTRHKFSCECFDYRKQNAPVICGQPQCKHILATKRALKEQDKAAATITQIEAMVVTQPDMDHEALPQPPVKETGVIKRKRAPKPTGPTPAELEKAQKRLFASMQQGAYGKAQGGTRIMESRKSPVQAAQS